MSWNIWEMATCLRVLDVTKFGAKPDVAGGGDGIQDAIDYAIANQTDKSWAIWVPPGDWKLTKPLILARSGDFIRVHMIGVPSSYASLGSQIIFDSLSLPVLIVQGARACTFEGLSFKGGNDIRGKFKPPYDMLVGDDSVFLKPGARDNPYSPQAVVQIDPFMPEYPDNDIANAYPSLEGYYGGSELPEPTGSSAITFRNCYFEAGVVGVGVSTPGPGQVGHDLVQNAENFAFENCSWVGCREAFVSGQSQSRGLNLHNPRIAFCRIAIDSSQYGLGGNPGNAPRLTGAPNIGICKYLFNVVTSWQVFTCENLYCEATMSIGFISRGIASLFGENLTMQSEEGASSLPLPTTLANTSLTIGEESAPLFFVSSGQVNFQVPCEVSGTQSLRVRTTTDEATLESQLMELEVSDLAPGMFTWPDGETAIALDFGPDGKSFFILDPSKPEAFASPGDFLVFYLSGLGQTIPTTQTNAPAQVPLPDLAQPPTISIGGKELPVLYGGWTPGFVGLYQINVQLSDDILTGVAVPVVVSAGGESSQTTAIPIGPGN